MADEPTQDAADDAAPPAASVSDDMPAGDDFITAYGTMTMSASLTSSGYSPGLFHEAAQDTETHRHTD